MNGVKLIYTIAFVKLLCFFSVVYAQPYYQCPKSVVCDSREGDYPVCVIVDNPLKLEFLSQSSVPANTFENREYNFTKASLPIAHKNITGYNNHVECDYTNSKYPYDSLTFSSTSLKQGATYSTAYNDSWSVTYDRKECNQDFIHCSFAIKND